MVIELARGLHIMAAFRHIAQSGARATRVFRRRGASDASRERAAMILSARMFRASLRGLLLLAVVATPYVMVFTFGDAAGAHLGMLSGNPAAKLILVGLCLSYAFVRYHVRKRL